VTQGIGIPPPHTDRSLERRHVRLLSLLKHRR
jgi:hypothetical protein